MAAEQAGTLARAPAVALGLAGMLLLLSFAVGWYSIDIRVERWTFDDAQLQNKGAALPPFVFDLEMQMLSIVTITRPEAFQDRIEAQGPPSYEEHAGRMGTVMLGVLLLELTAVVCFAVLAIFFALNKGRRHATTVRRLGVLFLFFSVFTVAYFAFAIGEAAQDDTNFLVDEFSFTDTTAYDISDVEVGFWKTWRTTSPQAVAVQPGQQEVWQVVAESRPSAGWWLLVGAAVTVAFAAVIHERPGITEGAPARAPVEPSPDDSSGAGE